MNNTNSYKVKVNGKWMQASDRVQAVFVSRQLRAINQDGDIRAFTDGKINDELTARLNKLVA